MPRTSDRRGVGVEAGSPTIGATGLELAWACPGDGVAAIDMDGRLEGSALLGVDGGGEAWVMRGRRLLSPSRRFEVEKDPPRELLRE